MEGYGKNLKPMDFCAASITLMNVDWFKPFKVAGILLTVLNLPREERFKKKWTILAGKLIICKCKQCRRTSDQHQQLP